MPSLFFVTCKIVQSCRWIPLGHDSEYWSLSIQKSSNNRDGGFRVITRKKTANNVSSETLSETLSEISNLQKFLEWEAQESRPNAWVTKFPRCLLQLRPATPWMAIEAIVESNPPIRLSSWNNPEDRAVAAARDTWSRYLRSFTCK